MTLKELHFFYKLCDSQKVSSVANELGISQSAISIGIKSLEEKLGEQLFDRIGKKLILNERGRLFYETTYKHFIALQDAKSMFAINKLQGTLQIASSKTISNCIMPNLYYKFLSQFNNVKIISDTLNSSEIIKKLLQGELDMGLIETQCEEVDLIKKKLFDDELILVTSDKNYQKKQYIDRVDKKWILRESGSGTKEVFLNSLGEFSQYIESFMELSEIDEIKQIILNNHDTITAISKLTVLEEIQEQKLFEIKLYNFEFKREFFLLYHKDKTQSFLFKEFCNFVEDSFQRYTKEHG